MSKQAELGGRAEDLYCVHQMTLAEISKRLGVAPRTLQNWKAAGNWEARRAALTSSESAFHGELFELGRVMARKIKDDLEKGEEVAPARYFSLGKIIETANKARDYEKQAIPPAPEDHRSPEERQAAYKDRIREIFGL